MGVKNNNITIRPPSVNCGVVCEKILRALPDWFGIEASLIQYVKDANTMPTIIVKDDDVVVGFLTIKKHFSETAEIHCMGILPQYHRKGIGKLLIKELENNLKNNGHDLSNLSRNILLETSSLDVSNYLETKHPSSLISSFYNYYYFNNKHFKDLREDIDQYFDQSSLHETQATGDILIR